MPSITETLLVVPFVLDRHRVWIVEDSDRVVKLDAVLAAKDLDRALDPCRAPAGNCLQVGQDLIEPRAQVCQDLIGIRGETVGGIEGGRRVADEDCVRQDLL